MQLDTDIEPTIRLPHMTSTDKQMDESEGSFSPADRRTDGQTDQAPCRAYMPTQAYGFISYLRVALAEAA